MYSADYVRKFTQLLSTHLLSSITFSFISGIILSSQFRYSGKALGYLPPLILPLLIIACLFYVARKNNLLIWLLLLITTGIGFQHHRQAVRVPASPSHIINRISSQTEVVLIGTLMEMVSFHGHNSRVLIAARSIRFSTSERLLPAKGKILLSLRGKWPGKYEAGDLLAIRCTVQRPGSTRTPGVFDYERYLVTQGIWVTGFVRSHVLIHRLDDKKNFCRTLRFVPERLRSRIAEHIDKFLTGDSAAIYRAVLLGDRSLISDTALESFKGSGTMHILAISGLHIAVISGILYYFIYWVLSRSEFLLLRSTLRKWVACLCVPFLVAYSLITGLNAPVTRAILMSCVVIGAVLLNRKKSPVSLIALAGLILLVANPLQLFSASFQLSFAAILSIVLILPTLENILHRESKTPFPKRTAVQKIRHWLSAAIFVSVAATLGTAPLLLFHFNRISTLGPIANLVIEPLICLWSLPIGIISIPFTFLAPEFSGLLLKTGAFGILFATKAASFFASLPFSSIRLPGPPLWLTVFYYSALLLAVKSKVPRPRRLSPPLIAVYLAVLFMLGQDRFIRNRPDTFQVTYLDIGQGSASLLEYPDGQRIIIDGGSSSTSQPGAGERVIAPFLWKKGIGSVDAIIITHPDADHYNGLEFIMEHFSPEILWVRDQFGHDENYRRLIRLARAEKVRVIVPRAGQRLLLPGTDITCIENLTPLSGQPAGHSSGDVRNRGIVIRAVYKDFTSLFPGDIETVAEKQLIKSRSNLRADVLLSPHHGSITSNSREFLDAVSPGHIIVSAARHAKGRFPHSGLEYDCAAQDITLLSTASQGTVTIKSTGVGYSVFTTEKFEDNPSYPYTEVLSGAGSCPVDR